MAVAGLVLGIVAIVLCWFPFVGWIVALLAIIFGAVGIGKAKRVGGRGKGMAIAGLVLGVIGALLGAIFFVLAMGTIKHSVNTYIKESKGVEARMELDQIGKLAKVAYGMNSAFPQGSTPLTPPGDCCSQPHHKCAAQPSAWANPVWKALDFQIDDPTYFRYSYRSSSPTSFVAIAVGDLDCDGTAETFELHGSVDHAGNPQTHLIAPPPGAD